MSLQKALSDNQFNTYHVNKTEEETVNSYANVDQYYSDYLSLYVDTLRRISSAEAASTPFLTSTPSDGDESARQGHVSDAAGGETFGTMHYYDRKSNMWMSAHQPVPRFMVEYGFQSFPSISTMRK